MQISRKALNMLYGFLKGTLLYTLHRQHGLSLLKILTNVVSNAQIVVLLSYFIETTPESHKIFALKQGMV